MYALLLAGGTGTRLWPLSKKNTPKQLLSPLGDNVSLLENTINRTINIGFEKSNIYLVTAQDQTDQMKKIWNPLGLGEIIAEPTAKNTAPAILLGVKKLMDQGIDHTASIYVFPSDHYIQNFQPNLSLSLKDIILCYRIQPTRAETGYGYMQAHTGGIIRKIRLFKEKPDLKTAEKWFDLWTSNPDLGEEEKYFWNSGIYAFSINSLACALKRIDESLYNLWYHSTYEEFLNQYNRLPKEPFDKLIAEKAYNLHSAPLPADSWRDIGSWESIDEAIRSSSDENLVLGKALLISEETKSCFISSDQPINIVCSGVENLTIIIKDNNILIANKNNAESFQHVLKKIQNNHPELME